MTAASTGTLYIGLMSGTSLDGIDAALVEFTDNIPRCIASHYQAYDADLKQRIHALQRAPEKTSNSDVLHQLWQLDIELAEHYATAVHALLQQTKFTAKNICAIGNHGQTLRHYPPNTQRSGPYYSIQIGDPNLLAERTGITVVSDFRRRDIAAGGQGAPLAPAFHQAVFTHPEKNRVILNIGGIANITHLAAKANKTVIGFDTGPGNTLLDTACQKYWQTAYDKNGEHAQQGKIIPALLNKLLNDNYFQQAAPKSTGFEYFDWRWIVQHYPALNNHAPHDIIATLTELSARTIADSILKLDTTTDELLLCGGGTHNAYLRARLQHYLPNVAFHTTAINNIDPDFVEAAAFAWLAYRTINNFSGNLPAVTGATGERILGGIYWGSSSIK
ncbi:MAG: anhydro-N-acetylmuramic acid kinase [Gammaproteobacteria bacterium]|nr:anhydro-N-acetylmuramic acid kinase [Gammaproteobacteria bacterium]